MSIEDTPDVAVWENEGGAVYSVEVPTADLPRARVARFARLHRNLLHLAAFGVLAVCIAAEGLTLKDAGFLILSVIVEVLP